MEHILFQCDAFSWYMASLPGFLVQISLEFTWSSRQVLYRPISEGFGYKLLQKMGWKDWWA